MEDNRHIENLFRDAFRNYEEPVKPGTWDAIRNRMEVSSDTGTEAINDSAPASTGTGMVSGSLVKWMAASLIMVGSVAGVIYFSQDNETAVIADQAVVLPATEIAPESVENTTSTAPANEAVSTESVAAAQPPASGADRPVQSANSDQLPVIQDQPMSSNQTLTDQQLSSAQQTEAPQASASSQTSDNQNKPSNTQESVTPAAVDEESEAITTISASAYSGTAPFTVIFDQSGPESELEWDFGNGVVKRSSGQLMHTYDEPGTYTVTVINPANTGAGKVQKMDIEVLKDLTIKYIPNVFTPNQDGLNDVFTFETDEFSEIEVVIYDKLGRPIARFTDLEKGWDGRLNSGKEAPPETYLYTIFATSSDNRKHQQKGTVRLIR